MARKPEAAVAAQGQLQCSICCYWGQMGILAPIPSSIHPVCSCPRPASTSDLLLVEADGILRLPWLANLRQLWLPRASFNVGSAATGGRWGFWLGADGDSGPHPQQYPPILQLPKAGFNVGSASRGGRWDSAVAMAREPEAAMAAQGQLQCWIC